MAGGSRQSAVGLSRLACLPTQEGPIWDSASWWGRETT